MADVRHRFFSRLYPHIAETAEKKGGTKYRRELLDGLSGRVVEVGAGHGLNFGHYPQGVTEVVAVEPEPHLRQLAEDAATRAAVPVEVRAGTADALPVGDSSCDAAVLSLVMCSVDDPDAALAEVRRVLKPGGALRFYEHVRAEEPRLARAQRIADRFRPYLAGGCHAGRDTVGAIERAGFEVTDQRRFPFKVCPIDFVSTPHVIGIARKPAG